MKRGKLSLVFSFLVQNETLTFDPKKKLLKTGKNFKFLRGGGYFLGGHNIYPYSTPSDNVKTRTGKKDRECGHNFELVMNRRNKITNVQYNTVHIHIF